MTKELSPQKGNIDVARYVALGDSVTAGYTNGALYYDGQQNSFAKIIANQFKLVGGGDFKQPLMNCESVGIDPLGYSRMTLKKIKEIKGIKDFEIVRQDPKGDSEALSTNVYTSLGPFNNMGVAGAKVITILAKGLGDPIRGTGNYNPFFTRMASSPATASILSDAISLDPTFFTLFIGNNDAIAYALSGATQDSITPPSGSVGIGFDGSMAAILNALVAKGAKGAIANIPDIDSLPYFTVMPYNGLLLNTLNASVLNQKYSPIGINFQVGKNPFLMSDPSENSMGVRPVKKGELVLLDILLDENKLGYLKAELPIPKKYVLTGDEISKIESAITEYNRIIKDMAIANNLAFVDLNSLVKMAKTDRVYNSVSFNLNYRRKGIYSLDGLHLTSFGQALLANEFIKSINARYGSTIPLVKSNRYRGIVFPD